MNLYAYCVSDEITTSTIESVTGVAGAGTRVVQYEKLAAVVSKFDGEQVAVSRENVLAHNHVLARVLAQTTPLPFRFGTVVSAARLQHYIESQEALLLTTLARVRGCVEMSVKIMWDVEAIKRETAERIANAGTHGDIDNLARGRGTAFLAAKRRAHLGDESLKQQAEEIKTWFVECIGDVVRESRVDLRPAEALVLQAAYLVERECLDVYRERIRRAREERPHLRFLTSGAWPPYSFSDVRA